MSEPIGKSSTAPASEYNTSSPPNSNMPDISDALSNLSDASRHVVAIAEGLRQSRSAAMIYTEALLLALNEDADGSLRGILGERAWDRDELIAWQAKNAGPWAYSGSPPASAASAVDIYGLRYSLNASRVLNLAEDEAHRQGLYRIEPYHLLIGILRNAECKARQWLVESGLADVDEILRLLLGYNPSATLSDEYTTEDQLGFGVTARVLAGSIARPETQPPVTFGIYGPWGSGKSSLMAQVAERLRERDGEQDEKRPGLLARWRRRRRRRPGDEGATPRIVCVKFNAWEYSDADKLWGGLVERIARAMDEDVDRPKRLGYWLTRRGGRLVRATLWGLGPFVVALTLGLLEMLWDWAGTQGAAPRLLVGLAGAMTSVRLVLRAWSEQSTLGGVVASAVKKADLSETEGAIHDVKTEFHEALRAYFQLDDDEKAPREDQVRAAIPARIKIVVLIDELDRCPLEQIVTILEAIKLFLSEGVFIVLIAIDARIAAEAIRLRYDRVRDRALPREYLEKIVQVPVGVPIASRDDVLRYGHTLMPGVTIPASERPGAGATDPVTGAPLGEDELPPPPPESLVAVEAADLPDTYLELETLADLAAEFLDSNPRRIKRLLNTYRYCKFLGAVRREPIKDDAWQTRTLRWLLLTMRWPDWVALLLRASRAPDAPSSTPELVKGLRADRASRFLAQAQWPPDEAAGWLPATRDELLALAERASNFVIECPCDFAPLGV